MINRTLAVSVLLALMLMGFAFPDYAADWGIDQLMQDLAAVHSDHVGFTEKKTIAILDKPIVSSGELFYTAPDHLEKRTLQPKPETLVLDHDTVVISHGSHTYHLQLDQYPALAAFMDSIRGTLAGDRKILERNFDLTLKGSREDWMLQLVPLDTQIKSQIRCIVINGAGHHLHSMEIDQADGDTSVMTMTPLKEP